MTRKTTQPIYPFAEAKIACYIRAKGEHEADWEACVLPQLRSVRDYIEHLESSPRFQRVTWQLFHESAQAAESLNRPALQKMLRLARADRFTHVVAYNLRTLTTNARDFFEIYDAFDKHHVRLVLLEEELVSCERHSRLIFDLIKSFAGSADVA